MSTSSKEQAAAAPLKSKGMSGTNPDDSTTKPGGGGNDPKPGQGHEPGGKGKKDKN